MHRRTAEQRADRDAAVRRVNVQLVALRHRHFSSSASNYKPARRKYLRHGQVFEVSN